MTGKGPNKTSVARLTTEIEQLGVEEQITIANHTKEEIDGLRRNLKGRGSGLGGGTSIALKPQTVNRMLGGPKPPLLIARDEKTWA